MQLDSQTSVIRSWVGEKIVLAWRSEATQGQSLRHWHIQMTPDSFPARAVVIPTGLTTLAGSAMPAEVDRGLMKVCGVLLASFGASVLLPSGEVITETGANDHLHSLTQ